MYIMHNIETNTLLSFFLSIIQKKKAIEMIAFFFITKEFLLLF